MDYIERVGNLHIHTLWSDGSADHVSVAQAAQKAGLDWLIITDHNVYPPQFQGWYDQTLLIVGEEIHDPDHPHQNHLLVFDAGQSLAPMGADPQESVDAVVAAGGYGALAHPFEHSGAYANEAEINWVDWPRGGYSAIEIWNYMSEFKSYISDPVVGLLYAYWPKLAMRGPFPETLAAWDAILAKRKVFAVGGSDVHATTYTLGPLKKVIFPYRKLFRAVNMHVLVKQDWGGDADEDAQLVHEALRMGRSWVGYDALGSTRGFRFWAQGRQQLYAMGETIPRGERTTFQVTLPRKGHIRLINNGFCVAEADAERLEFNARTPGVYRVEVTRPYAGTPRGWIYSNPIWLES